MEEIFGWKFKTGDTITFEWFDGTEYRKDTFTIGGEITNEKAYNDPECFTALGASGWFLMPADLVHSMIPENYNINAEFLVSTEWDSKEVEITQQLNTIITNSDNLQMRTLRDSINNNAGMYNTLLTSIIGLVLSSILARLYSDIGCAIGITFALFLQTIMLNIYYSCKLHIDIPRFWNEIFKPSIFPLSVCIIGWHFLHNNEWENFPILILNIIGFAIVFALLCCILSLNSYERNLLIRPLIKFIKTTNKKKQS